MVWDKNLKPRFHAHAKKKPAKRLPKASARSRVLSKDEAQQIVSAIHSGGIDALVMKDALGEKVVILQGAEQPYRVLVECVNDGAATLDSDGTVLYANTRFAELLSVPLPRLVGSSLQGHLSSTEHDKFQSLLGRGRRRRATGEVALGANESRSRLVRFTLAPFNDSNLSRVCVIATELTELVEANEALKSNEQSLRELSARLLQLQDEERRSLARDLHDVTGQKLAVQSMALSGLLSRYAGKLDAESQQALAESLVWNKEIAEEIRTLSYLLHPPLLDELGLSSAAKWYASGFTKRTGILIDVDIPTDLPRLSPDAEVAIFRVLQESLTNVHRYSGSQRASIRIGSDGDTVKVEVEDYGTGLRATKSASAQSSVDRLGVGIQGMTERMRQLGGKLEIISGPDQGVLVMATIPRSGGQVALPRSPTPADVSSPRPRASRSASGNHVARILIADDHEMLRHGVRNTLQTQSDLEVCGEAADGQDAIEKVKALHPDLVILDINMPVLNGLAAVRQILRLSPKTKILIFSVHDSDQTKREIHAAGAHGFISKGKDAQDLIRIVREVLQRNTPRTFA
jgi:signal transduction histidine kinase/ActR/RegA family two-component response regulator